MAFSLVRVQMLTSARAQRELRASPRNPKVCTDSRSENAHSLDVWYLRVNAWSHGSKVKHRTNQGRKASHLEAVASGAPGTYCGVQPSSHVQDAQARSLARGKQQYINAKATEASCAFGGTFPEGWCARGIPGSSGGLLRCRCLRPP